MSGPRSPTINLNARRITILYPSIKCRIHSLRNLIPILLDLTLTQHSVIQQQFRHLALPECHQQHQELYQELHQMHPHPHPESQDYHSQLNKHRSIPKPLTK